MAAPDGSGADGDRVSSGGKGKGNLRRRLARSLFGFDPQEVHGRLESVEENLRALEERTHETLSALQGEMERLRDGRVPALERRLDAVEQHHAAASNRLDGAESHLGELYRALTRLQEELEVFRDERIPAVETRLDVTEGDLGRFQGEVEILRDQRVPALESRSDRIEAELDRTERELQGELESLRDGRVSGLEQRLDAAERAAFQLAATVAEVRDRRLPAAVRRSDLLLDRLAQQLEEVASLVERLAAREPLPLPESSPEEDRLAEGLAEIQPRLMEVLRGPEDEIAHRMAELLPLLEGHAPVLDLGCGRGELLALLRERGMEATGIEGDAALARSARRRGLRVVEGDVLEVLLRLGDGSAGAVTAIHLLEHLSIGRLLKVLAEVRRVLRPGGLLLAECPNPASLRVGAEEFWKDPTHVRPLPEGLLELLINASGLEVTERRFLRPFPEEQRLPEVSVPGKEAPPELADLVSRMEAMRERLDELINGPRDYLLVARRSES